MSAIHSKQPQRSLDEYLADLAVDVLIDEADLSPKPGLVDKRGSGAHQDLHLGLMHASALSLWPCFRAMAEAALSEGEVTQTLREALGRIGREGEQEMLRVTAGVNTHRGAIWALGLLCAAAAQDSRQLTVSNVAVRAARIALLDDRAAPVSSDSHGAQVCRLYGVHGAREEAQQAFPSVIQHALPQLASSRAAGAGEQNARLDALLAIMSQLADTCVLYRAGLEGLRCVQSGARAVLDAGGVASLAGRRRLRELEGDMLQLRASPGGAADLLAACLFLDRLQPGLPAQLGSL
ncbi:MULTISPECIES: triphosphoribosyl-dephospho-CoA synthase [Pseudomonas]|uniref:Probable 2-(5''-triphosphoribosyl)-3'-dephosphocoenzyme-A synthase n=1 Tax=Pseudomonas fulva TaxID=47880 RepID=A0A0D0L8Q2_9PSED|nr:MULTISPECIES: triphosphoribosyl-dephospho-CoA synthase [Pseudomonas]KIQ06416.1 triphosphoribosyl-dephospho-CoA synthase [Pseudomonas fulva]